MRLDVWLKIKRITIKEFSHKIGISRSHLHQIIAGTRNPSSSLARVIEIETGGEVTAKELLGE